MKEVLFVKNREDLYYSWDRNGYDLFNIVGSVIESGVCVVRVGLYFIEFVYCVFK